MHRPTKAFRMLLIQRVSLLLNALFFAHLFLLYYGGAFEGQSRNQGIQKLEKAELDLENQRNIAQFNAVFAADLLKTASTESIPTSPKVSDQESSPIIYLITPTVNRPTRKADFTRLAQTVRQVPNLHWIVVEDGYELCGSVANILRRLVNKYTYLVAPTPDYRMLGFERDLNKGIFQRNVGLEWLRWRYKDSNPQPESGVVYFADDDNTYDLRLFEMIRNIRIVAVWPVALVGGVKLEKPKVDAATGRLTGFEVGFAQSRAFAVDMAGFALGLPLVLSKSKGHFPLDTVRGWNEPALFDSFDLSYDDVEVLGLNIRTPDGLLEPLVWHTRTSEANLGQEPRFKQNYGNRTSDQGWEV